MAEGLYLFTKNAAGGADTFINGINTVLMNADSGDTAAVRKAAAAAAAKAAVGGNFPATYFDTEVALGDLTTGTLKDPGDAYVVRPDSGPATSKIEG